jgi:hypothetical protein
MGDFEESLGDLKISKLLAATALEPSTAIDSPRLEPTAVDSHRRPSSAIDIGVTGSGTAVGAVVSPMCDDGGGGGGGWWRR